MRYQNVHFSDSVGHHSVFMPSLEQCLHAFVVCFGVGSGIVVAESKVRRIEVIQNNLIEVLNSHALRRMSDDFKMLL